MKQFPLLIFFLLSSLYQISAQSDQDIEELVSLAKTYGHLKYFHPSDEAADIDWDAYASYAVAKLLDKGNTSPLKGKLKSIFTPIAPTVKIYHQNENVDLSIADITPKDVKGYKQTYWQHLGIQLQTNSRNIYKSVRTNRETNNAALDQSFGGFGSNLPAELYRGKKFRFSAKVKNTSISTKTKAQLWVRVDRPNQKPGFFDNMDDRPIHSSEWATYVIEGTIGDDATRLVYGFFLTGQGEAYVDDLKIEIETESGWELLENFSCENEGQVKQFTKIGNGNHLFEWTGNQSEIDAQAVRVYTPPVDEGIANELFSSRPKPGEIISVSVGRDIMLSYPVSLYCNEDHTYPKANSKAFGDLKREISNVKVEDTDLNDRLAIVMIAWNVLEHFYPYFNEVKLEWEPVLKTSLREAWQAENGYDLLLVLRKMTAHLKDGHVNVWSPHDNQFHMPPITWEWVEGQLIITNVLNEKVDLAVGDQVVSIDGKSAKEWFKDFEQYVSAGTPGWAAYRLGSMTLRGKEFSEMNLTLLDGKKVRLLRSMGMRDHMNAQPKEIVYDTLEQGIYYVNVGEMDWTAMQAKLPELAKAKAVICDLRGYPKGNHQLISHLLSSPDTSANWMRIPQLIYPRLVKPCNYEQSGWQMPTAEPHISAKVFYLIDGSAISYAESYMGLIDHYNLATIIGQPTAGANGNVNRIRLPLNYNISFTGMRVFRHDGGQHHAYGVQPDVVMEKTIKGVKEGRDEFLEKALELAKKG